jgi:hypothetical protein
MAPCSLEDYGYDSNCFDILVGSLNPASCVNGSGIQYSQSSQLMLHSAICLWVAVLLILLQSVRTAVSIISRLPKSDTITPIQHAISCFRQHSDFRLCIFVFFASFLLAISRIISFVKKVSSNDGMIEPFWYNVSAPSNYGASFRVLDCTSSMLFDVSFLMISRRIVTRDKNKLLFYKEGSKSGRISVLKRFLSLPVFYRFLLFFFLDDLLLQYIRAGLIFEGGETNPPENQDNIHKLWAALCPLITALAVIYCVGTIISSRARQRAKSLRGGELQLVDRLEKALQKRERQSLYAAIISLLVFSVLLVKRLMFR